MLNKIFNKKIMKSLSIQTVFCVLVLSLLFTSCKKDEGLGGGATIKGKVFVQDFNVLGALQGEYYGEEERVYIVYGNNTIYSDDMRTHFDGSYQFDFLTKGSYTIYAYSDCLSCPSGKEVKTITGEITKNGQVLELADLVIAK